MDEPLARLRATNPTRHSNLGRLDPALMHRLRDHTTTQDAAASGAATAHRPRHARRLVTGGLAVALVGGGAAYASFDTWYRGGASDGLNCVHVWQDDADGLQPDAVGGPELTGDALADCDNYLAAAGREPIDDPVAFYWGDNTLYVAPADQVPAGAQLADPTLDGEAVRELEASLWDQVDGMLAGCRSADDARTFAASELQRLGLEGWTIPTPPEDSSARGKCAGSATADPTTRTIQLFPNRYDRERTVEDPGGTMPVVFEIRDGLRALAEQCLPLDEAARQAKQVLGTEDHWPTTTITDPDATCTRIDMEVGGSIQVTLRGPDTAS